MIPFCYGKEWPDEVQEISNHVGSTLSPTLNKKFEKAGSKIALILVINCGLCILDHRGEFKRLDLIKYSSPSYSITGRVCRKSLQKTIVFLPKDRLDSIISLRRLLNASIVSLFAIEVSSHKINLAYRSAWQHHSVYWIDKFFVLKNPKES